MLYLSPGWSFVLDVMMELVLISSMKQTLSV